MIKTGVQTHAKFNKVGYASHSQIKNPYVKWRTVNCQDHLSLLNTVIHRSQIQAANTVELLMVGIVMYNQTPSISASPYVEIILLLDNKFYKVTVILHQKAARIVKLSLDGHVPIL